MKFLNLLLFIVSSVPLMGQQFTHYTESDGLVNNFVNCLSIDDNQSVWFGTNRGLAMFNGEDWMSDTTHLINNYVTSVYAASSGDIWVGTDDGISVLSGSTWSSFTENDGLGDNRISSINEDENGLIWVGERAGVSVYNGTSWTSYGTSDGLPFGGIKYVTFDSNNDAWLASSLKGLIHFNGVDFTIYDTSSGLISKNIMSIAIDENDTKWVGTSKGISVLDQNNEVLAQHTILLTLPEPDTLNPVVDVKLDSQGNVWAGIYVDYLVSVGGVVAWNGSLWTEFTDPDALVGPGVRALAVDVDDNIWVATSTGVTKMTNPTLTLSTLETNLESVLYPNPSYNSINLKLAASCSLGIFNSLGQLVLDLDLEKGNNTIDVSSLVEGIYFVSIENLYSQKLIIQH